MSGYIVVAPFSNEQLRDWPGGHYAELLDHCVRNLDSTIKVIGTIHQRPMANLIVRNLPADRVENLCGLLPWARVSDLLAGAQVVVGNNSGIPHTAARLGVPTVCIFGGTHAESEWMPRGAHVFLITKHTVCSPCSRQSCVYGKRCLHEIPPLAVFDLVVRAAQTSAAGGKQNAKLAAA